MFGELQESDCGTPTYLSSSYTHVVLGSYSNAGGPVESGVATGCASVASIFSIGYCRAMQMISWCSRNVGGTAMKVL